MDPNVANEVFLVLWLIASAGVANMAPVVFAKIFPKLDYPMDFYKCFRGKRIFGSHKTIRGLIVGVVCAFFTHLLLINTSYKFSANHFEMVKPWINVLPFYFGAISGFLSLMADAVRSFLKRQINIAPGILWFPFDQIDWIFGTFIALALYGHVDATQIGIALILGGMLHIAAKAIGYILGFNSRII